MRSTSRRLRLYSIGLGCLLVGVVGSIGAARFAGSDDDRAGSASNLSGLQTATQGSATASGAAAVDGGATSTATTIDPTPGGDPAAANSGSTVTSTSGSTVTSTSGSTVTPVEGLDGLREGVLRFTNVEREKAGCGPVTLNSTLNEVAQAHSDDMAANGYFDHQARDGSWPWDRVARSAYPLKDNINISESTNENLALGYRDPEGVVAGWMSSPGHRSNLLDCDWTEMGVGYADGEASEPGIDGRYYTQVFAVPG